MNANTPTGTETRNEPLQNGSVNLQQPLQRNAGCHCPHCSKEVVSQNEIALFIELRRQQKENAILTACFFAMAFLFYRLRFAGNAD